MADSLLEKLRADINVARRDRDKFRTLVLTTTLSEAKNRGIELRRDLTDEDVRDVIGRAIKKRREAAEQIRAAGREELAAKEEQEAELLQTYMPAQLSEEQVREYVRAAVASGATTVGAVMSAVMPQVKGRFDGKETNRIVREELA